MERRHLISCKPTCNDRTSHECHDWNRGEIIQSTRWTMSSVHQPNKKVTCFNLMTEFILTIIRYWKRSNYPISNWASIPSPHPLPHPPMEWRQFKPLYAMSSDDPSWSTKPTTNGPFMDETHHQHSPFSPNSKTQLFLLIDGWHNSPDGLNNFSK